MTSCLSCFSSAQRTPNPRSTCGKTQQGCDTRLDKLKGGEQETHGCHFSSAWASTTGDGVHPWIAVGCCLIALKMPHTRFSMGRGPSSHADFIGGSSLFAPSTARLSSSERWAVVTKEWLVKRQESCVHGAWFEGRGACAGQPVLSCTWMRLDFSYTPEPNIAFLSHRRFP